MPYHTVTLQKILLKEEIELLLENISVPITNKDRVVTAFLDDTVEFDTTENGRVRPSFKSKTYIKSPSRRALHAINKGLRSLKFRKWFDMTHSCVVYSLQVMVELQWLLTDEYSNTLYVPSKYNNERLFDAFADAIYSLFPVIKGYIPHIDNRVEPFIPYKYAQKRNDELIEIELCDDDEEVFSVCSFKDKNYPSEIGALPFMALWQVKRIDASRNIDVSDKELYLKLCRASFLDYNGIKILENSHRNNNIEASSGSGRVKLLLYDKKEKLEDKIPEPGNKWMKTLLKPEIDNIIRYEVQLKPNREWMFSHFYQTDVFHTAIDKANVQKFECIYGILPFLYEIVADRLLNYHYNIYISTANWYNTASLNDIFNNLYNEGTITSQSRHSIVDGMIPLIRYAGSNINDALPLFEIGIHLDSWSSAEETIFGGQSEKTFRKHINTRRETGLQLVPLDDLAPEAECFPNPYHPDNFVLTGSAREANAVIKLPGLLIDSDPLTNSDKTQISFDNWSIYLNNAMLIDEQHRKQLAIDPDRIKEENEEYLADLREKYRLQHEQDDEPEEEPYW